MAAVQLRARGEPVANECLARALGAARPRGVEFYKAAFGAVEIYRVGGTDEHEEVVAQLTIGDASFWVSDESPANKNFSPESLGGSTVLGDWEAARRMATPGLSAKRWVSGTLIAAATGLYKRLHGHPLA